MVFRTGIFLKATTAHAPKRLNDGNDDEDSPEPVHDAGNGRQHLDGKTDNLADGEREKILTQKNRNRQPQRQGKNQRNQ